MRKQKGFTLIELMVTLVVIGILAAIAYPNYMEYLRSARRTAAMSCLMEQAHFMERYYSANMRYTGANPPACPGEVTKSYVVDADIPDADSYTLTATRTGAQAGDDCGDFRVTSAGVRDNINGSGGSCWK